MKILICSLLLFVIKPSTLFGQKTPVFVKLNDVKDLQNIHSEYTWVYVFGSWCPWCRYDIKQDIFKQHYADISGNNKRKVKVVFISSVNNLETIQKKLYPHVSEFVDTIYYRDGERGRSESTWLRDFSLNLANDSSTAVPKNFFFKNSDLIYYGTGLIKSDSVIKILNQLE